MSATGDVSVDSRSFSEPPTPRVRLTHRDIRFLKRPSELALQATVVVGFTHRNHPEGLRDALRSALQQVITQQMALLVLDDSSDEGWIHSLDASLLSDPRIAIAVGRLGSPAQARNGVLDLVELAYPCARWVARMDADDRFATPGSLHALVQAGDESDCHFVIGSNRLSVRGTELPDVNWANPAILLNRRSLNVFIQAFCRQQVPQELPSCNLLLRVGSGIRYPYAVSAEDVGADSKLSHRAD